MFVMSQNWLLILAVTAICHWLLPARWRGWFITAASAAFLAWLSPPSLVILSGFVLVLHYIAGRNDTISGRALVGLIALIGGILSFYKFGASMTHGMEMDADPLGTMIIPLGLSYYAFRCIHYGIEKYKGTIPAHPFAETAQYLFFLPTFLAGPIHRFHDFQKDLRRKRWDPYMFAQGLERLIYGYVKIAFLANLLVTNFFGGFIHDVADPGSSLEAYLMMIKISLNIYFLFAGLSDIAIGFGLLIGIKVMENFNFPFLAKNISDFWTRWHISLTSWCKDYVYMGTISVTRSAALAAIAAMVVMGLWHEFSLRYLLWGAFHGVGIMIWQQFQNVKPHLPQTSHKVAVSAWRVFSTLLTLHYFMLAVLLVNYASLETSLAQMQKILLFWM